MDETEREPNGTFGDVIAELDHVDDPDVFGCHPESCVKVGRKQAGRDVREVQPVHLIRQGREMDTSPYDA